MIMIMIIFGIGSVIVVNVIMIIYMCNRRDKPDETTPYNEPEEPLMSIHTVERFIGMVIKEKPVRFTALQLRIATTNYNKIIGRGGFGSVYKGNLFNGVPIAVKLLHDDSDSRIRKQFVAEVSTIGTTNHLNLVRLYGFCFERGLVALVYEFMKNGSLDRLLFCKNQKISMKKLYNIAVGTAKGITYLHEECEQRIIHYDIKPANILLGANFHPKVADFGLAKLCNREHTHMSITGFKGTPGYAAPEMWMPSTITHKCDVYSFGMVLFEILGGRRNLNINMSESQEWFPNWVWKKFEEGKMGEVFDKCGVDEKDREVADRMARVGMWCVQFRPNMRPLMSVVVNMLEGLMEVPIPSNPFKHMVGEYVGGADLGAMQLPSSSLRVI